MAKYVDAALGAVTGLTDIATGIGGLVLGAQQLQLQKEALKQNEQIISINKMSAQATAAANLGSLALAANRIVNMRDQLEQVGMTGGQINEILMTSGASTGNPNFVGAPSAGMNNFNRMYASDPTTRRYIANGQILTLTNGVSALRARPSASKPDMILGWDNPAAGASPFGTIRSVSSLSSIRTVPSLRSMSWDGYYGPASPAGSVRSARSSANSATSV
ncbi:minor capsid protein [Bovine calicivirus strain Kirklareli]|uniref:minor capsid protein n=1 Tax=Bovine calicivirus strain Kirklareli TaxID=1812179 RepID=UPI0006BDFC86|nr:minor capsid protein [Bovine calicivirus strain Kirklareli]ALC74363.1 minor capsid protein [Bovine calicivirus strain Kirklareli]